jgi:hypothetical protein
MNPEDVQKIFDGLNYSVEHPYRVKHPKEVLNDRTAHCLEASLLAAYLLPDYPQTILHLTINKHFGDSDADTSHAVFVYEKRGFLTLGLSRYPDLMSRETPYGTMESLVGSYSLEYNKMGFYVMRAVIADLDRMPNLIAWREEARDMTFMNEVIPRFGRDIDI